MIKYLFFIALTSLLIFCYQAPIQWTEKKDDRLFNTRWSNRDTINSDVWEFDSLSCYNARLRHEIDTMVQPFGVDMQWEVFNKCSLVVHATYYLRDNPSMPNYYHRVQP
jgi:hypothetical protein